MTTPTSAGGMPPGGPDGAVPLGPQAANRAATPSVVNAFRRHKIDSRVLAGEGLFGVVETDMMDFPKGRTADKFTLPD